MSILIKGMEMPKDGSWRSIRIYPDGTIGRPIGFGDYALVEGAKAVPVPPHGRLIDADVVFKRLQKQAMSVWGNGNPRYQIVLEVMDAIRFAPTIIEAESCKEKGE